MGDISVGSVLQTDLPHDHKKALSGEVRAEEQACTSSPCYGLRLWFSDTADPTAGRCCPALIASLALLADVHGIRSSGNCIS